ncbi:uncharacterized protein GGS22DRAFT_168830, partial [Annulohypoxylon maeteangense]|uniref:uncharacterized protein n=1 Tax=Annulohypoxylon maeteangense TaxID=1927788 RepID=UPI002007728C
SPNYRGIDRSCLRPEVAPQSAVCGYVLVCLSVLPSCLGLRTVRRWTGRYGCSFMGAMGQWVMVMRSLATFEPVIALPLHIMAMINE